MITIQRGRIAALVMALALTLLGSTGAAHPAAAQDLAEARVCLEARVALHLDWIGRESGASEVALDLLRAELEELVEDAADDAQRSSAVTDLSWVEGAWAQVLSAPDWISAWQAHLTVDQRQALDEQVEALELGLREASVELLLLIFSAELRLRQEHAVGFRERIAAWMADPRWNRARGIDADAFVLDHISEILAFSPIRTALAREQAERIFRMRLSRTDPRAQARDKGAWPISKGRYPEDDFVLEALAVAAAHGWDEEEAALLLRGAKALGREYRRSRWKPRESGDRILYRPIVDFEQESLWKALVRREEARLEVEAPAPGPWCTGDRAALVAGRSRLILAHLDRLLLLDGEQRPALAAALALEVDREYDRGTLGFGAVGAVPIWRDMQLPLRLGPGKRVQPRREFLAALRGVLTGAQLRALGIEEEER